MARKFLVIVCLATTLSASVAPCLAQGATRLGSAGGGLFTRLNKPVSPKLPTLPGVPTFSPLGLLAPRLSNIVLMGQLGGVRTPAGRLSALGVLSPRISPVAALAGMPSAAPQVRRLYFLTILSPRAAVLVGMMKAFAGTAGSLR